MSNLINTYKDIKRATVAIVGSLSKDPSFPPVIGTGFIAREDGIIFTNKHVIEAFEHLPRRKGAPETEWPAKVLLFQVTSEGTIITPLNIVGVGSPLPMNQKINYGENIPDIGIIEVNVKNLPTVKIADKFILQEGAEIATCGFPMGTDALRAPGWIHQLSPILQRGVISAILPMVCDNPHAIMIDIVTEGGASGSPVFDIATGEIVAILYAGLLETRDMTNHRENSALIYKNSTSHTLAIPSHYLQFALKGLSNNKEFKKGVEKKSLEEIQKLYTKETINPREPHMKERVQGEL